MTKRKNVLNQIPPINEVKNPIKPYEDKEKRIVFDISFKSLFYFIDCKGFTNRLRNEEMKKILAKNSLGLSSLFMSWKRKNFGKD